MDLQSLIAFKAVADQRSFSRAAEKLYLTQPAVSKRIASLENSLGIQLFDRIGNVISLTEAGRLLYPKAGSILAEVNECKTLLANIHQRIEGPLRFATSHHIGLHRLPNTLRKFKNRYPDVSLDLEFTESEQALELVLRGELEFALVTLPTTVPDQLRMIPLWQDELVFVCAASRPLKAGKLPEDCAAILPPPHTATRNIIETALEKYGLKYQVTMESHYLETIKKMVEIDLGWSALPAIMLDEKLKSIELQAAPHRQLGILLHHERTLSNAASAMLDLLGIQTE